MEQDGLRRGPATVRLHRQTHHPQAEFCSPKDLSDDGSRISSLVFSPLIVAADLVDLKLNDAVLDLMCCMYISGAGLHVL